MHDRALEANASRLYSGVSQMSALSAYDSAETRIRRSVQGHGGVHKIELLAPSHDLSGLIAK